MVHVGMSKDQVLALTALFGSSLSLGAGVVLALVLVLLAVVFRLTRKRRYKALSQMEKKEREKISWQKGRLTRLVFGLLVCNVILALQKVIDSTLLIANGSIDSKHQWYCKATGFLGQFLSLACAEYVFFISFSIFFFTFTKRLFSIPFEVFAHGFSWLVPFSVAFLPIIPGTPFKYEPVGAWCWIGPHPRYEQFVILYIWVWLVVGVIFVVYAYLLVYFWLRSRKDISYVLFQKEKGKVRKVLRLLMLYPLAYVVCWTPATVNRVVEATGHNVFALALLEALFIPLQGFVDCSLFGYLVLWKDIRKLCCTGKGDPQHGAYLPINISGAIGFPEEDDPSEEEGENRRLLRDERGERSHIGGRLHDSGSYYTGKL